MDATDLRFVVQLRVLQRGAFLQCDELKASVSTCNLVTKLSPKIASAHILQLSEGPSTGPSRPILITTSRFFSGVEAGKCARLCQLKTARFDTYDKTY